MGYSPGMAYRLYRLSRYIGFFKNIGYRLSAVTKYRLSVIG